MSNVYVVASARIRPEMVTTFVTAAKFCVAATRKEAGHIRYDAHVSLTDPSRFVFVEEWESQAAVDAHLAARHTTIFLSIVADCASEAPTIEIIKPEVVPSC